jgi:hypothetical protein
MNLCRAPLAARSISVQGNKRRCIAYSLPGKLAQAAYKPAHRLEQPARRSPHP